MLPSKKMTKSKNLLLDLELSCSTTIPKKEANDSQTAIKGDNSSELILVKTHRKTAENRPIEKRAAQTKTSNVPLQRP